MNGFEPCSWRLIVTGICEQDGVPYTAVDTEPEAYGVLQLRDAIEGQARTAFAHMHPGAEIASTRWYPLYNFGSGVLDPDDDGTDACGHGDDPDENCEGCHG